MLKLDKCFVLRAKKYLPGSYLEKNKVGAKKYDLIITFLVQGW